MSKRAVMPTTWLLVALLAIVGLRLILPGPVIVPLPWALIGLVPLALGVVLNLAADGAFHQVETTVKPFETSSVLVTDGVFRFSRNPMYLGFVLLLAGVALLVGATTPWLVVLAFGVYMDRAYIAVEERMLAETFGQAWTNYRAHVGRWILGL